MHRLFPAFLMVAAVACQPRTAALTDADVAAVRELGQSYVRAFSANDADGVIAVYGKDAVEMPPNLPARNGVDAIKAAYASYFASGAHTDAFTMTAQEIGGSGGVAFDRGTWSWTGREGGAAAPVTESGKYLGIARRQADGSWRYTDMIWNTDQPPAPPPAPQ